VAECVQAEGEEDSRTLRFGLKLRSNGNDVDPEVPRLKVVAYDFTGTGSCPFQLKLPSGRSRPYPNISPPSRTSTVA